MLIELFGKNFGCFRDPFNLSLLATDIEPGSTEGVVEVVIEGDPVPLRLLRCAAIYGPNASGKSTVIRAASALRYLLAESGGFSSDRKLDTYEPFALDEASGRRPSQLGARAVVEGRVYEYVIEFRRGSVTREQLIECRVDCETTLFDRKGDRVDGVWTDQPRFALLKDAFRSNALLLSLADQFAPDLAGGIASGLKRMLFVTDAARWTWFPLRGPNQQIARRLAEDTSFASWLMAVLRHADVGITDYVTSEDASDDEESAQARRVKRYLVTFGHQGTDATYPIPYARESRGTHKTLELAWYLHRVTHAESPQAFFIDEIAASLHPDLVVDLVRSFNRDSPMSRIKGQLIFATHETSLMEARPDSAVLRRDQIYFTEKTSDGSSRLYSLSEFRERNNLNLRKRYLQGRYGAVPSLGHFDMEMESE